MDEETAKGNIEDLRAYLNKTIYDDIKAHTDHTGNQLINIIKLLNESLHAVLINKNCPSALNEVLQTIYDPLQKMPTELSVAGLKKCFAFFREFGASWYWFTMNFSSGVNGYLTQVLEQTNKLIRNNKITEEIIQFDSAMFNEYETILKITKLFLYLLPNYFEFESPEKAEFSSFGFTLITLEPKNKQSLKTSFSGTLEALNNYIMNINDRRDENKTKIEEEQKKIKEQEKKKTEEERKKAEQKKKAEERKKQEEDKKKIKEQEKKKAEKESEKARQKKITEEKKKDKEKKRQDEQKKIEEETKKQEDKSNKTELSSYHRLNELIKKYEPTDNKDTYDKFIKKFNRIYAQHLSNKTNKIDESYKKINATNDHTEGEFRIVQAQLQLEIMNQKTIIGSPYQVVMTNVLTESNKIVKKSVNAGTSAQKNLPNNLSDITTVMYFTTKMVQSEHNLSAVKNLQNDIKFKQVRKKRGKYTGFWKAIYWCVQTVNERASLLVNKKHRGFVEEKITQIGFFSQIKKLDPLVSAEAKILGL